MIDWTVILTAAAVLAATVILIYTLSTLKEWVRERVGFFRNRQIIAGALRDRLETGNYRIVPFIYDEETDTVLDTELVEAQEVDNDLEQRFAGKDEIVWDREEIVQEILT
jgi:hypothetical protein